MASQNHNPASTSITACCPQRSQGTGHSMGKRLQQELMTLMMSGNTGIPIFPESDNHFKWTGAIHGAADRNPTLIAL
uniref:UBC core domain-containing protein n=1 Tax=Panthera tigris altaica TaxID=74533 RepID=A0A8C9JGH5_PANTA